MTSHRNKMNGTKRQPPPPPPAGMVRVSHKGGVLSVIDAAGRDVPGVIACDIAMRPGIPPLMRMNLAAGMFEVDGMSVFQVIDVTAGKFRPVARIVFADDGPDFIAPAPQPSPVAAPPAAPPAEPPAPANDAVEASHGD